MISTLKRFIAQNWTHFYLTTLGINLMLLLNRWHLWHNRWNLSNVCTFKRFKKTINTRLFVSQWIFVLKKEMRSNEWYAEHKELSNYQMPWTECTLKTKIVVSKMTQFWKKRCIKIMRHSFSFLFSCTFISQ